MTALANYGFPDRSIPEVTNSEVISRQSRVTRVRTEMHSCAFLQDVAVIADTIQTDIVPDESDFRSGYFRWLVSSSDHGGSHISFEAVSKTPRQTRAESSH